MLRFSEERDPAVLAAQLMRLRGIDPEDAYWRRGSRRGLDPES